VGNESDIRALFIEDDVRLARLTSEYLSGHGVGVTHVGDGVRGLEAAQHGTFDVVLLDVMLPGKSGLDVCRELRERSDVPVILLTARGEEADRVMGLELGADDYLPKPFSSRELLARIGAVVRRPGPTFPRARPPSTARSCRSPAMSSPFCASSPNTPAACCPANN